MEAEKSTAFKPLTGARAAIMLLAPLVCFFMSFYAVADTPPASSGCDRNAYMNRMAQLESSGGCATGSPGYTCTNSLGYLGRYQFNASYLNADQFKSLNPHPGTPITKAEYLNNPTLQDAFMQKLTNDNLAYINKNMSGLIGTTYKGVTVTQEGLLAACHLKGCYGTQQCIAGTGTCTDGYGTDVSKYLNAFSGSNCTAGETPTNQASSANPICDPNIRARVSEQVNSALTRKNEFVANNYMAPPSVSQVANTPCVSTELQRITGMFSSVAAPLYSTSLGGLAGGGLIGMLTNRLFSAENQSFQSLTGILGGLTNFQGMANTALSSITSGLQALGLNSQFASALCGLMVDTVLKYVQCVAPFQMPSLSGLLGNLNNLLPGGCAGAALQRGLYGAAYSQTLQTVNQPITVNNGGQFIPGSSVLGSTPPR